MNINSEAVVMMPVGSMRRESIANRNLISYVKTKGLWQPKQRKKEIDVLVTYYCILATDIRAAGPRGLLKAM